MVNYNFRKASSTMSEVKAKLDALQTDMEKLWNMGGVSAIDAHPQFKMRAAQLIRNVVMDEFSMTDPTPIFTERRDARLGDTIEFEELVNTLRVVKFAPNSHPLVFTPRKAKYSVTTAGYELAFGIPLIKVMTRQHSIGEYTSMASEALTRHYVNLTLSAIHTACMSNTDLRGRPLSSNVGAPDVTKEELDAALRRMGQYNTGTTIFASRWALDPIFDIGAAQAESISEELQRRGVIGYYRGARLVAIQDDYNDYYGEFTHINGVDLDKLIFIAGDNRGALLYERDLSALNWESVSQEKGQFRTGVRFDHGILVHRPWRYHVLELS